MKCPDFASRQVSRRMRRCHRTIKALSRSANLSRSTSGSSYRLNSLSPGDAGVLSLRQLCQSSRGSLSSCFFSTFTLDLEWFLETTTIGSRPVRTTIAVHDHRRKRNWERGGAARAEDRAGCCRLLYPALSAGRISATSGLGCMHSKLCLLFFTTHSGEEFVRIVITSANLTPGQWDHSTNTIWRQDFPKASPGGSTVPLAGEFRADLSAFIAALTAGIPDEVDWLAKLMSFDIGGKMPQIVTSIPGVHHSPGIF